MEKKCLCLEQQLVNEKEKNKKLIEQKLDLAKKDEELRGQ